MIDYVTRTRTVEEDIMPTLNYKKLQTLDGKAAVFVRGFMDYLTDNGINRADDGLPLRKAQEAGQANVKELGEEISLPYISKLSALLQDCQVVYKERRGKKFMLFPGIEFDPFYDFITDRSYGTSMTKELPIDQIQARSAFLDHMREYGAVRIKATDPLNKAAYQVAIDKFKSGEYDMVFLLKDRDLDVLDYGPSHEWTSDLFMGSTHASVGD